MPDILANNAIKELEEDLSVVVEGIEARETEGQETEIEEKGQPSMNPMDVPPAIEAAKLSSKIEELTNNLGLHIDLGHLLKLKNGFFVRMQGALRICKQIFGNSIDILWNFMLVRSWFRNPYLCRELSQP